MNYSKKIMQNIPNVGYITIDSLFKKTKLKNLDKFNYALSQLQKNGFISIGNCNDIILLKPYFFYEQHVKQNRNNFIYRWLPIVISIIALIKSFLPELALLWKLLMQLLK